MRARLVLRGRRVSPQARFHCSSERLSVLGKDVPAASTSAGWPRHWRLVSRPSSLRADTAEKGWPARLWECGGASSPTGRDPTAGLAFRLAREKADPSVSSDGSSPAVARLTDRESSSRCGKLEFAATTAGVAGGVRSLHPLKLLRSVDSRVIRWLSWRERVGHSFANQYLKQLVMASHQDHSRRDV